MERNRRFAASRKINSRRADSSQLLEEMEEIGKRNQSPLPHRLVLPLAMADAAAYIRARQPQPLYLA
jgi:hypothetical protein